MTDDLYKNPPYAPHPVKPDGEEDALSLYASPLDEVGLVDRIVPLRRRGKKMPGTFKYTGVELYDMLKRFFLDFMPERKVYHTEMLKGGPMAGTAVPIEKTAMATLEMFLLYCDMTPSTWYNYCKNPEMRDVCDMVKMSLRAHQIELGAAGEAHPGIVARIQGLAEHTDIQSGGKTIEVVPIQFSFSRKSLEGQLNKSLDAFDELK